MALHRRAAAIKLGILRRLEIGGNSAFDLVSVERYLAALMAESAKLHVALFRPGKQSNDEHLAELGRRYAY